MFRATTEERFEGPHQNQHVEVAGKDPEKSEGAMILLHGRGASAQSIMTLKDEFNAPELYYVAPQASDHQWYPNSFLAPTERNEPGLSSGLQMIHEIVISLEKTGIPKEKVILLGFSQGACLVTEYAARHPAKFGGLAASSAIRFLPKTIPAHWRALPFSWGAVISIRTFRKNVSMKQNKY